MDARKHAQPIIVATVLAGLLLTLTSFGCGTVRNTNTPRTGTEQAILSSSFDEALHRIDFGPLTGVPVYFDTKNIEGLDKGWIISSIREAMAIRGVRLKDKPEDATVIVEGRVGAYGTDDHSFMIGVPQTTIPVTLAGLPTGTIPEIALMKKSDQYALTKLALFAYDKSSGGVVWISGTSSGFANSKNLFIGGLGPIETGTHKKKPEFMGMVLPQMTVQPVPIPVLPWDEAEPEPDKSKKNAGQSPDRSGTNAAPLFQHKELGGQEPGTVVPIPIPLPTPGGSPFASRFFQGFAPKDKTLIQSKNSDGDPESSTSSETPSSSSNTP